MTCTQQFRVRFLVTSLTIKNKEDERVGGVKKGKHSNKFNKMFSFYLSLHRSGLVSFCGSKVEVEFDVTEVDGKECFKSFENGEYKLRSIVTRHNNVIHGVISGKKGWGLWVKQWSQGIVDWTFTKEEIVSEFTSVGITIPDNLMKEWDKLIHRLKLKRNEEYMGQLR